MRYLHAMLRVADPKAAIRFFKLLGLEERRRQDNDQGRFTLIFLGVPGEDAEVELTHNWDNEDAYAGAAISATWLTRLRTFTRCASG